jgi:hypothetical protein
MILRRLFVLIGALCAVGCAHQELDSADATTGSGSDAPSTMKHRLQTLHVFPCPAREVWTLLADFGAIDRWWPKDSPVRIERVEVEGTGVGMIRHIYVAGLEHPIDERLDFLDEANMVLRLSHARPTPPNLPYYRATGRLADLDGGRSAFTYEGEFSTAPGEENAGRDRLLRSYANMFRGLEQACVGSGRDRD